MRQIITKNENQDDILIPVQLSANHAQLSLEETLKDYAQSQMAVSINPHADVEAVRYRPDIGVEVIIRPEFLRQGSYANDYTFAGFNIASLYAQSPIMRNSVFVFDYYDSDDTAKQHFLFSQVARANERGSYMVGNGFILPSISVSANSRSEFNVLYMPRTATASTVYLKISFFNSSTGKTVVFQRDSGIGEESNLFIPIKLTSDKKYSFDNFTGTTLSVYQSTVFGAIIEEDKKAKNITPKPKVEIERGYYRPLAKDPEILRSA